MGEGWLFNLSPPGTPRIRSKKGGETGSPRSPSALSPAQSPPAAESHWILLEAGLLHVEGRLQSAEPVQADGGPQWAGAAGAERPRRPGELCWGSWGEGCH